MSELGAPLPSLPDMIDAVRAKDALIHNLPPAATQELASRYGIYTATETRDPGTFIEFQRTWERERSFAEIASKVGTLLSGTEQYRDAVHQGMLGERLVAAFGSITRIECDDVYLAKSDQIPQDQQGIVKAAETRLFVPDAEQADNVSVAMQGLLSTGSVESFYPVTTEKEPDGSRFIVKVENLDEHAARSLSRSVEAVVAQEDGERGVTLPPSKRTHETWKENGVTFPPAVEQRLLKAREDYERLELAATYRGYTNLTPRPKPHIIGTDAAAFFEGIRDIFNGLIHPVRGGSHLNLEQHPIKSARPLVEAGVDLRRDKATLQQVELGPLSSRPARLAEKGADQGREQLRDARRRPLHAIARGISSALSLPSTILDAAGTAVKYAPAGSEAARGLLKARNEWERRRKLAAAGGKRLDRIASQRRREDAGLGDWE
jgi:hypothetical protein